MVVLQVMGCCDYWQLGCLGELLLQQACQRLSLPVAIYTMSHHVARFIWLLLQHVLAFHCAQTRDVQREIPVPSLPHGLNFSLPGISHTGIPGKFPRFGNFPSCGNFGNSHPTGNSCFLGAHTLDFQSIFCVGKLVL